MVKSISVLGCTGSIGRQTLAVARHTGIRVAAMTANRQLDLLEEQALLFRPEDGAPRYRHPRRQRHGGPP